MRRTPRKRARKPARPVKYVLPAWGESHVEVPTRLVSEANTRTHWRAKAKRVASQRLITKAVLSGVPRPALPVAVLLTRVAPGELDDDNLSGACKAVRDEVAAWLGIDDRDPRVFFVYEQTSRAPRTYGVSIGWRSVDAASIARQRGAVLGLFAKG